MEVNREEAARCLRIARAHLAQGNLQSAEKFANKSNNMYASDEAKSFLAELKQDSNSSNTAANGHAHTSTGSSTSSSTASSRHTPSNASTEDESASKQRNYTDEQVAAVKRIRSCGTDFYKVLGLEKDAAESDIKKAYRKLALQFHPDKNQAPGADEAFKLIGRAFGVLSDSNKREHYDRFGAEDRFSSDAAAPSGNGYTQFRTYQGYDGGADEISPEELFNMFFGMGGAGANIFGSAFGPNVRVRHFGGGGNGAQFFHAPHQFRQQQQQHHHHHQQHDRRQQSFFGTLVQFLPLLLLVAFSLFSSIFSFSSASVEPTYYFEPRAKYNALRHTPVHKMRYYVNSDEFGRFNERYPTKVRGFEEQVEVRYMNILRQKCKNEMDERADRINYAQGWTDWTTDHDALKQARNMKLARCEELKKYSGR
ncbi:DnaJ-domain-containing protein [Ramicandelaber brevisporus]|nr:DnaJ-domain-containing protein [Ramicandelaber brevisporus]